MNQKRERVTGHFQPPLGGGKVQRHPVFATELDTVNAPQSGPQGSQRLRRLQEGEGIVDPQSITERIEQGRRGVETKKRLFADHRQIGQITQPGAMGGGRCGQSHQIRRQLADFCQRIHDVRYPLLGSHRLQLLTIAPAQCNHLDPGLPQCLHMDHPPVSAHYHGSFHRASPCVFIITAINRAPCAPA